MSDSERGVSVLEDVRSCWNACWIFIEDHDNLGLVIEEVGLVREYFDDLPVAPEPDWNTAPEDAQFYTVDPYGEGEYWDHKPKPKHTVWESGNGLEPIKTVYVDLPLGIDWRTTLQRRPQEETHAEIE